MPNTTTNRSGRKSAGAITPRTDAHKTPQVSIPESYLSRIAEFPLIHIRDESHLDEATAIIDAMLQERLDEGSQQYLDALSDLVMVCEEKHHPMSVPSGIAVLKHLIDAKDVTQTEVAKQTGIAVSTISGFLHGKRKMTTAHIRALSEYFRVSTSLLMGD